LETLIREYNHSDKISCLEAFRSNVPYYFTEKEVDDFDNFLTRIEKETNKTCYYVLIFEHKLIGCGGFGHNLEDESIISLAWGLVHKEYHKKGFGEKLFLHRIEKIKHYYPGVPITIDTTQFSFGFFEKYGFRTTKITKDYYAIGMHRYDMKYEKSDYPSL
jgi:ribosomal protein S18 acetylase RimI-like enzyme